MAGDHLDRVLALLAVLRSSTPMNDMTIAAYRLVLAGVPIDELREVVLHFVRTEPFRPSPAEILRAVVDRRYGLPEPHEAWTRVLSVVEARKGWNELPEPVRKAGEYVGGAWAIRSAEKPAILRSQFVNAYEEFRRAWTIDAIEALQPSRELRELTT